LTYPAEGRKVSLRQDGKERPPADRSAETLIPSRLGWQGHGEIRMPRQGRAALWIFTPVIVLLLTTGLLATQTIQAQTLTVLHNFTGGGDGAEPQAGVTMDRAGNLYGTASSGGAGLGTVFRLARAGSGWVLTPLYSFAGGSDGAFPQAGVIIGSNGTLYGSTTFGGAGASGTVFNVRPTATACKSALCPWMETVLYSFQGGSDGAHPRYGDLVFDPAGNIYGTTYDGGDDDGGTVFELLPSGGGWTEEVLHRFPSSMDGKGPMSGLVLDATGNLYGTTFKGGQYEAGTVFSLHPSGSSWTENTLYSFKDQADGSSPIGGLIFDQSGNLYGSSADGMSNGGVIFEMTPQLSGSWTFNVLFGFVYPGDYDCPGPWSSLTADAVGNLYGTAIFDGSYQNGSVFKLTPSNGGWTYTDLHDFTGQSDGGMPVGGVVLDAQGNLYGTTSAGGSLNLGVVFEITP